MQMSCIHNGPTSFPFLYADPSFRMMYSVVSLWAVCNLVLETYCKNAQTPVSDLHKRLQEHTKDHEFGRLMEDLTEKLRYDLNCLTVITDSFYNDFLSIHFFLKLRKIPLLKIMVEDNEDLLSPNYKTLSVIQQSRRGGCNVYIILIANADQGLRFLRFGDRHRVIDTRARFIMLYDIRLFHKNYYYLWKKIVNIIFLRKLANTHRYEFTTVPFPMPIKSIFNPIKINSWRSGQFQKNIELFTDKTSNLRAEQLKIATFHYIPSTLIKMIEEIGEDEVRYLKIIKEYSGLEIQILESLADAMNFQFIIDEPANSKLEAWGRKQLNGSYSGLLGVMTSGRADLALGNLLYTPHNLQLLDLSIPYTTQCFTFLTPESTTDNSWKTLILPFKKYMWIGLLLTLIISTVVFFGLSNFHEFLKEDQQLSGNRRVQYSFWKDLFKLWQEKKSTTLNMKKNSVQINDVNAPIGLYLFSKMDNSLMNAYSMLLLVSLPKMPSGWSLRMFTGWWWLFCILVTVAYRASMTAILANPAQRVTIDTLNELAASPIGCGGWGEDNKEFFTTSLDWAGQRVGKKFEVIYDANEAISRVAKGTFAYYDNVYFLQSAKAMAKQKQNKSVLNETKEINGTNIFQEEKDLHIMGDCVINMPVSLGLQKNSPLKPNVDKFLQRVIEGGLIKKWLADVMMNITAVESQFENLQLKALMDLKKFVGALVLLGVGYLLGIIALIGENIYWYYFVKKHPLFDKYHKGKLFQKISK